MLSVATAVYTQQQRRNERMADRVIHLQRVASRRRESRAYDPIFQCIKNL